MSTEIEVLINISPDHKTRITTTISSSISWKVSLIVFLHMLFLSSLISPLGLLAYSTVQKLHSMDHLFDLE